MGTVAILPHTLPDIGLTGSDAVEFWYGHILPADAAIFMEITPEALQASQDDGSGPPVIVTADGDRYRRVDLFHFLRAAD